MMRDEIGNIVDSMAEIVNILSPATLNCIIEPVRKINRSLEKIIESMNTGREYMVLSDNPEEHVYYVNNLYAKSQLQRIVPKGSNIRIDPEIQIGTIIMVKQY